MTDDRSLTKVFRRRRQKLGRMPQRIPNDLPVYLFFKKGLPLTHESRYYGDASPGNSGVTPNHPR
jgi:hypothetical protein